MSSDCEEHGGPLERLLHGPVAVVLFVLAVLAIIAGELYETDCTQVRCSRGRAVLVTHLCVCQEKP